MSVRVSWKVLALLVAIVVVSLLLVAHVVGWYVQVAIFALLAVLALVLLVRHGFKRAAYAVRGRGKPRRD
jgi:hypothetical protein